MTGRMLLRAIAAQTETEMRLTLRRGESVLVTLIIPASLLVFFSTAKILPGAARHIAFLLAGTVALAVISTGLVSLGIATAYERYYRVLKRLGITPFPRSALVASKLLAVLAVEIVQVAVLAGIALLFGWRPGGSTILAIPALILGTAAFAGVGLWLAGSLRAEATLGVANGLFLFFLLLGGLYVPLDNLPVALADVARLLPAAALADTLRGVVGSTPTIPWSSVAVLTVWAVAAPALAARAFQWE